MKPFQVGDSVVPVLVLVACSALGVGCSSLTSLEGLGFESLGRAADADSEPTASEAQRQESDDEAERPRLVGDYAMPWGGHFLAVEAVGLCTELNDTGSDPPHNSRRNVLVAEMLRHQVPRPAELLADQRTALVLARAFLPPGARKGDRVDIEVRTPSRSETTSLERGWLMEVRLQEMAALGGQIRTGNVGALAAGSVLIDSIGTGSTDPVAQVRGQILGGGVVTRDRTMGLVLKEEHHNAIISARISEAVSGRFQVFDGGNKRGVATPKTDEYIEILPHATYRDNISRYLRVVREVPVQQREKARQRWLRRLGQDLLDRDTTVLAALRLEALGRESIPMLRRGLNSDDPEVRFYAAEAMAYLNDASAAPVLGQFARESAFRWHALTALSVMDDLAAQEELMELLDEPSAETRFGAFRAMQSMSPYDPTVRGTRLGDALVWHQVPSTAEPLVHVFAQTPTRDRLLRRAVPNGQ